MTPTQRYVAVLQDLEPGVLGLLRQHAGQGLDESVDGFDLFAGLWWPLRKKNERAPKREVAWLIAKLYAFCPMRQSNGSMIARQLRQCQPMRETEKTRFIRRFDAMLSQSVRDLEPSLRWAVDVVARRYAMLDWTRLTDDLSMWDRESTRIVWAEEFLGTKERS